MVWSSLKDIQAKKTSSKAYFQSLLLHLTGKFYEIQDTSMQVFFWTNQIFMKGLPRFFLDKWEMVSAF